MKPSNLLKERDAIVRALRFTVSDLKGWMTISPEEYTERGNDGPSVDVRLCVDEDGWILRTGSSDFDPYHSRFCSTSCITLETEEVDLAEELISGAIDQMADQMAEES